MLTDRQCRTAAAEGKPTKLSDTGGLYLYVTPTGLKSWRLKYRFGGKEKKITFGRYPELSLKDARRARDRAKEMLIRSIDPQAEKARLADQDAKANNNTFDNISQEWLEQKRPNLTARYLKNVENRLTNATDVFGKEPITDITPEMLLGLVRSIQARGAYSMAIRVMQICSDIFAFAIATGRAQTNPAEAIRRAITRPSVRRCPAQINLESAKRTLQKIESVQDVWWPKLLASRLLALTVARPGIIRFAEKSEFEGLEGTNPIWRVPARKMKLKKADKDDPRFDFIIPLSTQAVATASLAIDHSPSDTWLFPGQQSWRNPMNENAMSNLYREAGLRDKQVPHGWRATFSTIMNERAALEGRDGDRGVIDLMLAHMEDTVEIAYNRAAYMARRREIAQEWADLICDGLAQPSTLLQT